ncbi:DnaJ like chaperone protein [Acetobacter orientalis]|uniref:DnaJ like chaperone protein n=1 Tax=Acetobacter orientalis TaxID=146474 RepID=A0A2Z5ZHJ5_9PROT|nr:DnaJ like chaperone protein [Acetobacter orientalis]
MANPATPPKTLPQIAILFVFNLVYAQRTERTTHRYVPP